MQQQDAHEFLNYLLNTIADLLQGMLVVVTINHTHTHTPQLSSLPQSSIIWCCVCCFSWAEAAGSTKRPNVDPWDIPRRSHQWDKVPMLWDSSQQRRRLPWSLCGRWTKHFSHSLPQVTHYFPIGKLIEQLLVSIWVVVLLIQDILDIWDSVSGEQVLLWGVL